MGAKGKARATVKLDTATTVESKGISRVNCSYKWTNCVDEEDEQVSPRESEPGGEKEEELTSLETPDDEGEWCWPRRNRIT